MSLFAQNVWTNNGKNACHYLRVLTNLSTWQLVWLKQRIRFSRVSDDIHCFIKTKSAYFVETLSLRTRSWQARLWIIHVRRVCKNRVKNGRSLSIWWRFSVANCSQMQMPAADRFEITFVLNAHSLRVVHIFKNADVFFYCGYCHALKLPAQSAALQVNVIDHLRLPQRKKHSTKWLRKQQTKQIIDEIDQQPQYK